MTVTIIEASGPIVSAKISGELGTREVGELQSLAKQAIQRGGKVSALFILENFRGWKREPGWGDMTFLTEHDKNIAKIAVIGEEKWRDLVYAFLAKGFRDAAIEFFLPAELAKARAWLDADAP
jgi:hypothetical protein